ncbi:MAG: type I-C CRISPR-associated protein Cas8c/Csd1 [Nocardioides sp.]|uniref:type I-C CRISPR-associated protein Cas8c/Csd1 n=1 Tax=Nocardioides sp. TaxID=35761 RepID=UPI0039E71F84
MIITALTKHQPSQGVVPPGYARKALGFELTILTGGSGCRLGALYREDPKGKLAAPMRVIPNMNRSNNPPPIIGCDTAAFVLARPKPAEDDAARARELGVAQRKQHAFAELLQEYADESGDRVVDDYIAWVRLGMPGLEAAVAGLDAFALKRLDIDPIALQFDAEDRAFFEKASVKQFWGARVAEAKSGGAEGLCLSCGRLGPVVDTLPQSLAGARIPATSTSQVALMSVNFASAARGATGSGLKSAPLCPSCAGAAVTAFNDLAADPEHRFDLGDASAAVWWATEDLLKGQITSLDDSKLNPERVQALYNSVVSGVRDERSLGRFYFLSFSGNVARLVVRRWIDLELAEVQEHVANWFTDIENPDRDRPYLPISTLAKSLGPAPAGDRKERAPEGSFEALLLTALTGIRPPRGLLQLAVSRALAEVRMLADDDNLVRWRARQRAMARLAVIRLVLNRTDKELSMSAHLDESRREKAYLSGRLFYVRESLQRRSARREDAPGREVNASIVDRYFARAVLNPQSVEAALTVLSMQHEHALRRQGEKGARDAAVLWRRIAKLHALIEDAPGRLSSREQAAWIAGYFQQRESDIQAAIERSKRNKLKDHPDSADTEEN